MILTFNATEVRRILRHSMESSKHKPIYDKAGIPGLWLVGDEGIYLMSNGDPGLKVEPDNPESKRQVVAYARECDPKLCPDTWWETKRLAFGGSDGCELLVTGWFKELLVPGNRKRLFRLNVTPKHISNYRPR